MRLALVLCLLVVSPILAAPPLPPSLENAVQDSKGIVWAFSRAQYNRIYRYDGQEWTVRDVSFPGKERAMPAFVVRMTDGSVACIWRVLKDKVPHVGVSIQSGTDIRVLGICEGEIPDSGLKVKPFSDSKNRLWITGESSEIFRAGPETVTSVHELKPEEYVGGKKKKDGYNDVHAVEDGRGRIWVWSDPHASNYSSLRGVLIFTDDQYEVRDTFGSIKGDKVLALAKADDKHMWMTVSNDGVYRVNIDTFEIEREADPSPKALCCIHELHVHGDDLYAVESMPAFKDTLWRRRNGQWKQLMPFLDASYSSFIPRSWLPVKEGMLVESYQAGPWFIPLEGEAIQFSWKTGFPMENVRALTQFADGSFFALGRNGQIFRGPLELPPKLLKENPRVEAIDTADEWAIDPSGHLWILTKTKPQSLQEWDGKKWIPHPVPGLTDRIMASVVKSDTLGRIWPMPGQSKQAAVILDPKTGKWLTYPGIQEAFIALKKTPPKFLADEWFLTPQYSKDGKRIAYREGVIWLHYYDGTTWQKWDREQITGKKGSDGAIGVPWFDDQGRLNVNIRQKTSWRMESEGKWSEVPYASHFPADIWSEGGNRPPRPIPPEGAVTKDSSSIAVDNLGVTWLQWENRLYKCVPNICIPVFGEDEITPFSVKRMIQEVYVDSYGNAFLKTAAGTMGWYMIRPKNPAPHTTLKVEATGKDSVKIAMDPNSTSPIQFRWQLDNGPEQITKDRTLTLSSLPNGNHELKVFASDDELQMESKPAIAKFKTYVDLQTQLANLIARLSSPDYEERKAAIQALALQPAAASVALKKARAKADSSAQWWIDAALQEIESRAAPLPQKQAPTE